MPIRPDIATAILLLGIVSCACRFGGFFLMRYVSMTKRVEGWLGAIPVALVGAILGPVAVKGGPPEWLGLMTAIVLMRATSNEFIGAAGAIAMVAVARTLAQG
jgi:uncharacterized membrane protein